MKKPKTLMLWMCRASEAMRSFERQLAIAQYGNLMPTAKRYRLIGKINMECNPHNRSDVRDALSEALKNPIPERST